MTRRFVALFCLSVAPMLLSMGDLYAQTLETKPTEVNAAEFETLQQAIDALPNSGGILRLPPGTFELTKPLVIEHENILLAGAGSATQLVNKNEFGESAILVRHKNWEATKNTVKPWGSESVLWRIQFSNFRITGNKKSGHGIEAHFINEIFIDNMTISYHGGDAVHLDRCYENARVNDSLLTYNAGSGVYALGCHDLVVGTNQFEENRDAIQFINGFNLCATGNIIDDHLRHGIVIENSQNNTVSGNMIEQCADTGLVLDRNVISTTVASNIFIHNACGVDARDVHGSTISANTFAAQPKRGLVIGTESSRLTVAGNTFADSYIGKGKTKWTSEKNASSGIFLNATALHTITGNTFSNLITKAITLDGKPSRHIIFSQNLLVNVESDHEQLVDSQTTGNLVVTR